MDKIMLTPIEITLYGADDEPIKTYSKSVIRWGVLKKATKIANQIRESGDNAFSSDFDAISDFVCLMFDNAFTARQLEDGADVSDIMACFRAVVNRANSLGNA